MYISLFFLWGLQVLLWANQASPAPRNLEDLRLSERATAGQIQGALREILSSESGSVLLRTERLKQVYQGREFRPVFAGDATDLQLAGRLLEALGEARSHGLSISRYRTADIDSVLVSIENTPASLWIRWFGGPRSAREVARLDLLLTDRYLALAEDLAGVGAARQASDAEAPAAPSPAAVPADSIVASLVADSLHRPVTDWAPTHPQYEALRSAWKRYFPVVQQGGWPFVSPGGTIRPGERDSRVAEVRARLDREEELLSGVPSVASPDPTLFDEDLAARVSRFQARHRLDADGAVGKATLAGLNVTAAERLKQIEVSLARWREGPRGEPEHRVEVNIPGMMVYFFDQAAERLALRTVVGSGRESPEWKGKTSRAETPELVDQIETIEINPRWYIPEIIVRTELLAKEKKKPGYLDKGGYEWYDPKTGNHGPASEIPEEDWTNPAKRLNLRQRSGAQNSLGRIKFVFHNRYAVYLHDTPEKNLFKRGRRNFSHGCVRVENPAVLAESLLAYSQRKAKRPVAELMADTARVVITLKPAVPIHLVYRTVWVERDSVVHFLPDIYVRDPEMERLLSAQATPRGPGSFGQTREPARAAGED